MRFGLRSARDAGGSVAVITAIAFGAILGAGAIALDLGVLFGTKRQAQGAVDLAAMLAAGTPTTADTSARISLADNGYTEAGRIVVRPGRYNVAAGVATSARFTAGATPVNAVRVDLSARANTVFARMIGLPATYDFPVTGLAASAQFAAFSLGTGVASLDSGIANAVLGAMLGTTLSLNLLDYDALLTTRLDSFRFLDALATTLNLQAANYSDVLAANASVGQIVSALSASVSGFSATTALGKLAASVPQSGGTISISKLLDLGDSGSLSPGQGSQGPSLELYDMVSAAIGLANGNRQVSVDLGLTIPGLLGTKLTIAVGERRVSSGWVQPGSPNATLRSAQTRILIETSLKAPLNLGALSLPVYAEVGSAQANLRAISCPWSATGQRRVDLDVTPGLLDLAIAKVPRSAITATGPAPNLSQPADLLTLVLPPLAITGQARTTVGSRTAQSVSFNEDDIVRHRERSVSTTGMVGSATATLLGSLDLGINGIGALGLPLLRPLLITTLSAVAPAIDGILDNTLRTLGVRVGTADVTADGARCDRAVLVQ